MSDTNAVTYDDAIAMTQVDGNVPDANSGTVAAIMNTGASATCKITTARGSAVTIYMVQGLIYPIATKNVWTTGSGGLSTVIGFVSRTYPGKLV